MSSSNSPTIDRTTCAKPDLDCPAEITRMVQGFYDVLLEDQLMAPLFLEVAGVDLREHLPTISLYWQKMLLGDKTYHNNTMAKHRAVNRKSPFREEHFNTWLRYFLANVDQHFAGPYAEKAKRIARNVIKNMRNQLSAPQHESQGERSGTGT